MKILAAFKKKSTWAVIFTGIGGYLSGNGTITDFLAAFMALFN